MKQAHRLKLSMHSPRGPSTQIVFSCIWPILLFSFPTHISVQLQTHVIFVAGGDLWHNQSLRALFYGECKCYWTVVIEKVHHAILRHWHERCPREADGNVRPQV